MKNWAASVIVLGAMTLSGCQTAKQVGDTTGPVIYAKAGMTGASALTDFEACGKQAQNARYERMQVTSSGGGLIGVLTTVAITSVVNGMRRAEARRKAWNGCLSARSYEKVEVPDAIADAFGEADSNEQRAAIIDDWVASPSYTQIADWFAADRTATAEAYRDYLDKYPTGEFRYQALTRASLRDDQVVPLSRVRENAVLAVVISDLYGINRNGWTRAGVNSDGPLDCGPDIEAIANFTVKNGVISGRLESGSFSRPVKLNGEMGEDGTVTLSSAWPHDDPFRFEGTYNDAGLVEGRLRGTSSAGCDQPLWFEAFLDGTAPDESLLAAASIGTSSREANWESHYQALARASTQHNQDLPLSTIRENSVLTVVVPDLLGIDSNGWKRGGVNNNGPADCGTNVEAIGTFTVTNGVVSGQLGSSSFKRPAALEGEIGEDGTVILSSTWPHDDPLRFEGAFNDAGSLKGRLQGTSSAGCDQPLLIKAFPPNASPNVSFFAQAAGHAPTRASVVPQVASSQQPLAIAPALSSTAPDAASELSAEPLDNAVETKSADGDEMSESRQVATAPPARAQETSDLPWQESNSETGASDPIEDQAQFQGATLVGTVKGDGAKSDYGRVFCSSTTPQALQLEIDNDAVTGSLTRHSDGKQIPISGKVEDDTINAEFVSPGSFIKFVVRGRIADNAISGKIFAPSIGSCSATFDVAVAEVETPLLSDGLPGDQSSEQSAAIEAEPRETESEQVAALASEPETKATETDSFQGFEVSDNTQVATAPRAIEEKSGTLFNDSERPDANVEPLLETACSESEPSVKRWEGEIVGDGIRGEFGGPAYFCRSTEPRPITLLTNTGCMRGTFISPTTNQPIEITGERIGDRIRGKIGMEWTEQFVFIGRIDDDTLTGSIYNPKLISCTSKVRVTLAR